MTVLTTTKEEEESLKLDVPMEGFRLIEVPPSKIQSWLRRRYRRQTSNGGHSEEGWLMRLRHGTGVCCSCRMPDHAELWRRAALKRIAQEGKWDLVVTTAGPYVTHAIAHRLKRMGLAKRWTADFRDLWADSEIYPGIFPFNVIETYLERRWMRHANTITAVTPPHVELLAERHGAEKVHLIENGFEPRDLERLDPTPYFPQDGKIRLVHTGQIYPGLRDPTPLFQAIQRIEEKRQLEVLFVGNMQFGIRDLSQKYGLEEIVKMPGMVSRDKALRMQRDADGLILLGSETDGALTGKLFEYLYSGRPILGIGISARHPAGAVIAAAGMGWPLSENVDSMEKCLREGLAGQWSCDEDREVLKRFERGPLAERMLKIAVGEPG